MGLHRRSHIRRKRVRAPSSSRGRAPLVDGYAPHAETLSVRPGTNLNLVGLRRLASRPLCPSPGPSIADPLQNRQNRTQDPTIEDLPQED